jgi:predicted  nucleic acid-binding Zn-ribbon protein
VALSAAATQALICISCDQVVKEKKADLERLQAQHAATRTALSAAETRAEATAGELTAARAEGRELTSRLAHAHDDASMLAEVCKRVSMAPGVTGSDVVAQVRT